MHKMIPMAMVCVLFSAGARADEFVGRTGLPSLKGAIVKLTSAQVKLAITSRTITTTQNLRIEVGGKEAKEIELTWREDDFNSGGVNAESAKGFQRARFTVDGRTVKPEASDWLKNVKGDTLTRRHVLKMTVQPGSKHRIDLTTSAPVGKRGGRPAVQFVNKDLGGFAGPPTRLEINAALPKNKAANVEGVEPKPTDISRNGIRWVWNKATPGRDVFILLP